MKTIIYTTNKEEDKFTTLAKGIIAIAISIIGLIFDSKIILKLFIYIFPILLIIYFLNLLKTALYFWTKNKKEFIERLIKALVPLLIAIYIIINPVNTLSFIITIVGIIMIVNVIWNFFVNNAFSLGQFILSLICILFAEVIIDTFYTIFLVLILVYGIYQISRFVKSNRK